MRTVLAIDAGRSALKIIAFWCDNNGTRKLRQLLLPSAVCQASTLTDEGAAKQARLETVSVGGKSYWFGKTALWQGSDDMTGGLSDNWFFADEHFALILGAIEVAKRADVPGLDEAMVLIGLPGKLYTGRKAAYQAEVSKHLSSTAQVLVIPQPIGPFYDFFYDENGSERADMNALGQYTIIEIGQHTTDFALVSERTGRESAYSSCGGMSVVATNLQRDLADQNFNLQLPAINETLAAGCFKYSGKTHDATALISKAGADVARQIINHANRHLGDDVYRSDAILLAGGGAGVIAPHLKTTWQHLVALDEPRYCVARGFAKLGQLLLSAA